MASRNQPTLKSERNENDVSRRELLFRGLAAAVGVSVLPSSVSLNTCFAAPENEYNKAIQNWTKKRTSSSLSERFEALSQVVKTKESAAFDILVEEFLAKDSQKHQDKLLELIAPLAAENFLGKDFDAKWDKLFTSKEFSSNNLNNCWLVYSVFSRRYSPPEGSTQLAAFASRADVDIAFRTAIVRVLVRQDITELSTIASRFASVPTSQDNVASAGRGAFIEAVADLVKARFTYFPLAKGEGIPKIVLQLITMLDDENLPLRAKRRIGKIVADAFHSKTIFKDGKSWRDYLEGRKTAESLKAEGYAVPEEQTQYFFGAKGTGLNFCYVIDMSGSMTEPLVLNSSAPSKPQAPPKKAGPITQSGGESPAGREQGNPALNPIPGIEDLPLDKIKTRLDAAKEALKASLRELPADASFSIVVFGKEGKILTDEKNMVAATPKNIEAACVTIDKLAVMGTTNLHRGVELAFEVGNKGVKKPGLPPTPSLYDGPDVLFILSDGIPNEDSYTTNVGRERLALFADHKNLARSIRRMNLFSNSFINYITIGVSDAHAFDYLANQTGGALVKIGK